MKLYNLSLICFSVFLLRCYKDTSEYGKNPLSEIMIKTDIKDIYNVDKWDSFVLEPEVEQDSKEKPLQYEWQIGGEVVGTEKKLDFQTTELGTFPVRYKVYNDDGATFARFTLQVDSPYQSGLLALGKNDSGTTLSFKRLDKNTGSFIENVFALNNPNPIKALGQDPLAIYSYGDHVYISSGNPGVFLRIDSKTFLESYTYDDYPNNGVVEGFISASRERAYSFLFVLGNGYLY